MTFSCGPLHGHLPPISQTIQLRRARHAGHCLRSKEKLISDVLLWTPTQPFTSHLTNHPNKTNKICGTLLEKQGRPHVMLFYGPLHMDVPVLADQQELIYISSVWTQDIVWKTRRGVVDDMCEKKKRVKETRPDSMTWWSLVAGNRITVYAQILFKSYNYLF